MSFRYALLKGLFHVIPFQKLMAKPYDELMRLFKTEGAEPQIPQLSDPALTFETIRVGRLQSPVLMIRHRKPAGAVCIYVTGGGMLKYPLPSQARGLIALAKRTGRDFALPYFPLCPDHDLYDALDMLEAAYRRVAAEYQPQHTAFLGGSSGAYMTLCLMTWLNRRMGEERQQSGAGQQDPDGWEIGMPEKLYLCSPGSGLYPEERRRAEELNRTDLIMSTQALDTIFDGMAGGKKLPDALYYMQQGDYTGVRDVYLVYGGDEIFSAAADSTAARLRSFGARVRLEVGAGMYHVYAAMPLVPEAQPAYERMIRYLSIPSVP